MPSLFSSKDKISVMNRYDDVAEALRDHLRVCLVSDGYVSSVAPCGRSSIKTIVREYMRRYDIPTDAEPGWVDGRVEIYSRRKGAEEEVDAAPFWFNEKGEWTLTYPAGELRADGYRYWKPRLQSPLPRRNALQ